MPVVTTPEAGIGFIPASFACGDGQHQLARDFADRKLVKVYTNERRRATCKYCGDAVVWLKTVNRERFMLFDGDAVALKTGDDPVAGSVEYYDREDCHWESCASKQETTDSQ